jgi:dual-specificity kinase
MDLFPFPARRFRASLGSYLRV